MSTRRTARLFRSDGDQAVRIPAGLELPGTEVLIHRDGDRLIIEPKPPETPRPPEKNWLELLREMEPIPDFPEVDDSDLPPQRDVDL